MYYIIRFIKGHLQIKLSGLSTERFLNLCKNHQIYLWNIIHKPEENSIQANIHLRDYFKMISILKKTETHATVMHKYGLPFQLPFYRKKIIFILTLLALCIYLCAASSYIWAISIHGNRTVSDEEIGDFLKQHQVSVGIRKSSLPIEQLEMDLRDYFPVITWTSIQIRGTHCILYIQENIHPDIPLTEDSYADIVADKEGQIVSIITRKGIPKVSIGDSVKKDTILVEGNVPVYDEAGEVLSYQYYEADADIYIKTAEHFTYQIPKQYLLKEYTGQQFKQLRFQFHHVTCQLPYYIPLSHIIQTVPERGLFNPFRSSPFEHSTKQIDKEQLKLFSNLYLPIYRSKIVEKEYLLLEKEYSESEMESMLTEQVNKFILCLQEKGVQIMQKDVKIKKNIAVSEVTADFITIEPVGEKVTMKRE